MKRASLLGARAKRLALKQVGVAAAMLILASCGGDSDAPGVLMTGAWRGDFSGELAGVRISLSLLELDGEISGGGSLLAGAESLPLTVTGTHAHPSVLLTFSSEGFEDSFYSGQFNGDNTINGSLSGSGFAGDAVTFQRQGTR